MAEFSRQNDNPLQCPSRSTNKVSIPRGATILYRVPDIVQPDTLADSHVAYLEHYQDRLDVITSWLSTCSESHQCLEQDALKRPSRLLCITADALKLVRTSEYVELPRYATLSYCWGTDKFLTLTRDNINEFHIGISIEKLPTTFRDAIFVARKLGLQYIWIDALCIIQSDDDDSDWLIESSLMRSIYGNSYLNIAATSTMGAHSSLFSMPTNYCGGVLARITSKDHSQVRNFFNFQEYELSTSFNQLASRAWAFQERLLAPRTIYIGDRGLFWECRSKIASEFLPRVTLGRQSKQLVLPRNRQWKWADIVEHYSKGKLTKASDKLPALSGIARRQHEVDGGSYLAGMWRDQLTKQLGWMSVGESTRPAWRAPSWSWTSIDGPINYLKVQDAEGQMENDYVEVVDVSTSIAGPDLFGAVDAGQLRLACDVLLHGRYRTNGQARSANVIHRGEALSFPVTIDCPSDIDAALTQDHAIYLLPLFRAKTPMVFRIQLDPEDVLDFEDSEIEGSRNGSIIRRVMMISSLALKSEGSRKNVFRRIGAMNLLSMDSRGSRLEEYHVFLRLLKDLSQSTAEDEGSQVQLFSNPSRARHVITIL